MRSMKKANTETGFWERCKELLGSDFDAFCAAQKNPLPKTIRVNTLRNTIDDFLGWRKEKHPKWNLSPHIFGEGVFAIDREDRTVPIGKSFGHIQGRLYMQEASSCLPPLALDIQPGQKVLDVASAPGSKTTQMAALMNNTGLLVANEYSGTRIKTLVFNLQKAGVGNTMVTKFSGEKFGEALPEFFDRILLDAPCTGEGTARKDSDALTNWSEKRILSAAKLQKSLIISAFQSLAIGGKLTYSTCTLGPEENEAVVTFLQEQFPDAVEVLDLRNLFPGAEKGAGMTSFEGREFPDGEKMLRIWPHTFNSEGFFVATIRKTQSVMKTSCVSKKRFILHGKSKPLNPGEVLRHKDSTVYFVRDFFRSFFGYSLPEKAPLFRRGTDIWLLPDEESIEVIKALRAERLGVRLGKMHSDKRGNTVFRISHEASLVFGKDFSGDHVVEVDYETAQDFLATKNIPAPSFTPKGDVVVRYEGLPLGIGKGMGEMIKNNLPRNFLLEESY